MVAHRRFGKTVGCVNDDIRACLRSKHWRTGTPLSAYRAAYVAPLLKQAKAIAWDYVKQYTAPIPGMSYNETELRADFPNGARYRLLGADNPDSARGMRFDRVTEDEPADMRPGFHTTIILPALADREGQWTKIGTPKGHSEFYDDYKRALDDPDTYVGMFKASQTGILPESELAILRRSMSGDMYEQEMECSFEAAIVGAYYGKLLEQAEKDGRVRELPYEPRLPVNVYFDLGFNDSTAMWFVQPDTMGYHRIIRYYENNGESIAHYINVLNDFKSQGYAYGEIVLPHDAEIANLQTGSTIAKAFRDKGYNPYVLPRTDNVLGDIETVRVTLTRCYFDRENTKDGLEALKQYRKEWDDKRQVFRDRPLHDWTSHGADAFRYFCQHVARLSPANDNFIIPSRRFVV